MRELLLEILIQILWQTTRYIF